MFNRIVYLLEKVKMDELVNTYYQVTYFTCQHLNEIQTHDLKNVNYQFL